MANIYHFQGGVQHSPSGSRNSSEQKIGEQQQVHEGKSGWNAGVNIKTRSDWFHYEQPFSSTWGLEGNEGKTSIQADKDRATIS